MLMEKSRQKNDNFFRSTIGRLIKKKEQIFDLLFQIESGKLKFESCTFQIEKAKT